ncbi:MAG TPA: hypothetical protein VKT21_01320, partial [Thermoplasmata archaeon]|nr:hypothetical protein [Thermoplasmata archaeon]
MTARTTSPVAWVQVMQALVARELVEGMGLPERQAAALLGVVPSSVSQYLSGKRLGAQLARFLEDAGARQVARRAAHGLMTDREGRSFLLEAAIELSELHGPPGSGRTRTDPATTPPPVRREAPQWLRDRIVGEQHAVAECMRLA